jgi:NAD(P)H-dependent FMN reductase
MDKIRDVALIVESLRKGSLNRKVANALAELAPATLKLSIIEIGHLRSTTRMLRDLAAFAAPGLRAMCRCSRQLMRHKPA